MTVEILLATYQGEKYIIPLLESIKNQTDLDISLTIRDDGSKDGTIQSITDCLSNWNRPWRVVTASTKNHGPVVNFSCLAEMANLENHYVMFADQDDIWLPEKVEITMKKMKKMEAQFGYETPLLVHTDLFVVTQDLSQISPSFWDYTKIHPDLNELNRTLIQNSVTGCTMMVNRFLLELANPIPLDIVMHDWWLALVAAAFGRIGIVSEPTILYRQHGNNQVGAKKYAIKLNLSENLKSLQLVRQRLEKIFRQADVFYQRYQKELPAAKNELVKAFIDLPAGSFLNKRRTLLKYGFFKHQWQSNIALFAMI